MDILQVKSDLLLKGNFGPALDLPETGEPGLDVQAFTLLERVFGDLARHGGARSDQRYIAKQDVKKLWHFIDAEATDKFTHTGDARVCFHFENHAVAGFVSRYQLVLHLVGIAVHGSKLVKIEQAAVLPHPFL